MTVGANKSIQKSKEGGCSLIMSLNSFDEFEDMHRSVLQEICNIGAGNAATAVSQMISAATDISTPQVKTVASALAGKIADMHSSGSEAFLIKLSGDMLGSVLFVFPCAFIERLAGSFFPGVSIKSREDIDEMSASVVQETVNIVSAAYANSFALMTGMTVDISVPQRVSAPSAEILAVNREGTASVCFVNNSIEITDCKKSFSVLFYPELDTIKAFMGKLGVEC